MKVNEVPELQTVECPKCFMSLLVEKGAGIPKDHVCRLRDLYNSSQDALNRNAEALGVSREQLLTAIRTSHVRNQSVQGDLTIEKERYGNGLIIRNRKKGTSYHLSERIATAVIEAVVESERVKRR